MSLRVSAVVLGVLIALPALAPERVRADKKALAEENVRLTEDEAAGFWPIYEGYQQELDRIYNRMTKVIVEYVKAHTDHTLTDEQARALTDEVLDIDVTEAGLAKSYAAKLDTILSARKSRALQIERKIRALLRCDLADAIPLVK
jgi:hypothetical protein